MSHYQNTRLRVRYSAIINFVSFIYRLIISIGFSALVIRRLSIDEYGLFTTIFAIYGVFTPVTTLWMTWTYRYYSRKGVNKIVTTGHTLGYIYSIVAGFLTLVFVLLIPYVYVAEKYGLIIVLLVISSTESLRILYQVYSLFVLSYKPYIVGYIGLISETIRFIFAFILVHYLKMGLLGALIAIFLTFLTADLSFIYIMLLRKSIPWPGIGIHREGLYLFFKNAYISLIGILKNQIDSFGDRLLTGLLSSSPVFPAYLGVAGISRRLVRGGGAPFTKSLSPSLLRKPNRRDIEDIIRITALIMFFVSGSLIIYSKTIISLFNPLYLNVVPLFVFYAIVPIFEIFTSLYNQIGTSSDRQDLFASGLALKNSIIFKNNLAMLIGSIAKFVISALVFGTLYFIFNITDVSVLYVFPLSSIIVNLCLAYLFYKTSMKLVKYGIPLREFFASFIGIIGVYVFASLSGLNNYMITRISRDYTIILIDIAASLSIYIAMIYILSPWARRFLSRGFNLVIRIIYESNDE